jgi:hypothetical protein
MKKQQLLKLLEKIPDNTEIFIRNIGEKRDYPIEIQNIKYPQYNSQYDYLSLNELKQYWKEDYNDLKYLEFIKDWEKIATIIIDSET